MRRLPRILSTICVLIIVGVGIVLYWLVVRKPRAALPREEVSITFIEGQTLERYGAELKAHGLVRSLDIWRHAVVLDTAAAQGKERVPARFLKLFPELFAGKPPSAGLEGYFSPDTYRFYKDSSPRRIIEKALGEMDEKFDLNLREKIARQNKTIFEILTMASLVEAEGQADGDRARIADILWRRLDAGMPLQVDSSVNFVTGKRAARLSAVDVGFDTPYNTYKYAGLPPGPINNPSFASVRAAVYPSANPYWYFISGRDGQIHYARTLAEHNSNIAQYLR